MGSALDLVPCFRVCVWVSMYSWLNCLISWVLDDISFWNLLETFLGCFYTFFQKNANCLYLCQFVSWLTFLHILGKYSDISCSWWDIFLKYFGDILGMFVHFFQIITIFLFVCQSISWLTSLMKLGQFRNISCSWWDIFLKLYGDIPRIFLHHFQIISNFL